MARTIYYLAQHDGGHEAVETQDLGADTHAEVAATHGEAAGGDHGGGGGPIQAQPNLAVWTLIAFAIVFYGIYRLTPRLLAMIDERAEKIAGDIQAAEDAKGDAEKLQAEYQQQLADARAEARKIVDAARQQADGQAREIMAAAQADVATLKQRAQEEIDSEKARAVKDLRGQIGDLSCAVASRLINETVTADTHRGLIDAFIDELSTGDGSRN